MASADEAHSRPKRPAAMTRQSSSQSHLSQSPSEGHTRPAHHKARGHHVVGQRVQRNASFGKNLNKLNKAAQAAQQAQQAQAADSTARHHRRSQSGASISTPSSPRPSFKRNASSGAIVRATHTAHTQVNLRKNHSSGHLTHKGPAKHAVKSSKSDVATPKRANRSRPSSPETHPTVHFDVAGEEEEEEGGEDGWTEESASQSPTTTRSNTRSNSVVLEAQHKLAEKNMENNRGGASQAGSDQEHTTQAPQTLTDRTRDNTRTNGGSSSQHHSRPADADMITSRLLQRSASHHNPAQTSTATATVLPSANRQHLLSGSAGSTLVDTPGRDLVSRFMDGDGSAGTPHDGAYMASHNTGTGQEGNLDNSKRNKSMPNVSGADTPSKTASRSGATTPTNLPPSRTQQKLMLQRASSAIEPQKLVPVTLPRTGGPTFLQSGIHYNANGEGRLDPRLQQQFNHVTVEYNVVRRYRNPLADSVARIQHTPGMSRKTRIPGSGFASTNGSANARGSNSLSTSFSNDAGVETDGASSSRRSRVSFDSNEQGRDRGSRDEGDGEGRQSFESDEAEEICRRLWESAEVVEAD
ncbi:hypothetical protein T440DRAFT_191933 [Plenodomus tracheiphilus IPT5]|uniref:Uncharacterized protein n=1 Tax=Plenodomus tracheiphilus IPT5 TaxID=1408161 RepID=A0A6A7AZF9_9PLEO|nr:hypothetical protein T440DRAFT_191933 [Plenodomus tracheiphilus IPT5]